MLLLLFVYCSKRIIVTCIDEQEAVPLCANSSKMELGDSFFKEQSLFLTGTCKLLTNVRNNLLSLLGQFANPPQQLVLGAETARLQDQIQVLTENIKLFIDSNNGARQAMACDIECLRTKYQNLQTEWDSQQEHLGRLQGDMYKMRNQLQHQSQFCASLGAVLGNLIWKASRIPQVVDMLLSGNKMGDFLNIVNGTLVSFIETYDSHMPGQCADESQFIMSMCGIITNIAASPAGRQFLVTNPTGKELLDMFVRVLPRIPCPSGNCLKRLILMALYNVSINQYGLNFLQEKKDILPAIAQNLHCDCSNDLRMMSLRLLQSITYEISTIKLLEDIDKSIPFEMIDELISSEDAEGKPVAQEILDNMERARQKFGVGAGGRHQKTVPYNRCFFVQAGETIHEDLQKQKNPTTRHLAPPNPK